MSIRGTDSYNNIHFIPYLLITISNHKIKYEWNSDTNFSHLCLVLFLFISFIIKDSYLKIIGKRVRIFLFKCTFEATSRRTNANWKRVKWEERGISRILVFAGIRNYKKSLNARVTERSLRYLFGSSSDNFRYMRIFTWELNWRIASYLQRGLASAKNFS